MRMTPNKPEVEPVPSKAANAKPPDIASASASDTLAALHVNPETGITSAEVDTRRQEHGYNEVAEMKGHPLIVFLGKFWGLSAWMLELIMVLSAVLRKFPDLAVVSTLLVVNAVVSFMQGAGLPASWKRYAAGYRLVRACCVIRVGRSSPHGNWSPATSFACDPAT